MWVLYGSAREIEIHTPDKMIRSVGVEDTLEASELLPGFQFSVRVNLE